MWTDKYKKAVTFSYDDGVEADRKLVQIFNRYGMKCTFNLNYGIQNPQSSWVNSGVTISRMPKEGLKELYKGHETASHSYEHKNLVELTAEEIEEDMKKDIAGLESLFGCKIMGMAYPYGTFDDKTVEALKNVGMKYARTTMTNHSFDVQQDLLRFQSTCHHADPELMALAKKFVESDPDKPQIFYVWGHSYEFDVNNNWNVIEDLCKYLSGRDDIFFGTNSEVLLGL